MKKFNLKPRKKRERKPWWQLKRKKEKGKEQRNLIKDFCPIAPDIVWVTDFTYIKYQGRFIYLSTVMDIFTREVVGLNLLRFHNKYLVLGALEDGLKKGRKPKYLHFDQGVEFEAKEYQQKLKQLNITPSVSKKASPWENGYQESFYSSFKLELGETCRFETIGKLTEEIYRIVWYYNNKRIHTSLKMTPKEFRERYYKIKK